MDQNWIHILMILVFYQRISSGAGGESVVQNGQKIEITCKPNEINTLIVWFRVLDKSGMDFIASFSNIGRIKATQANFASKFSDSKMGQHKLILESFNENDSGLYTCASLIKGNELRFGEVTRLVGEKPEEAQATTPSKPDLCTTAAPCTCVTSNKRGETKPSMFCSPIILGALAGGCGLLLLLLIITSVYCNKIRTRRCPHHYKRKPRTMPAGTKMQTNRHC